MAETAVFVVDPFGWERSFKSWSGSPVGTWMRAKTAEVRLIATALAPPGRIQNTTGIYWGHGSLKGGITTTLRYALPSQDLESHVIGMPKQALWIHEGTKPHVIVPKVAKILRFRTRHGTIVYAKKVNHPGIKVTNPFLSDALEAVF